MRRLDGSNNGISNLKRNYVSFLLHISIGHHVPDKRENYATKNYMGRTQNNTNVIHPFPISFNHMYSLIDRIKSLITK